MKTIKMKSKDATKKNYRKKCIHYEKIIKMMAVINADQNDRAAKINQEVRKVVAERKFLLKKLAALNVVVEPAQLYYKGKCESKVYKECCKERQTKKKNRKKSQ